MRVTGESTLGVVKVGEQSIRTTFAWRGHNMSRVPSTNKGTVYGTSSSSTTTDGRFNPTMALLDPTTPTDNPTPSSRMGTGMGTNYIIVLTVVTAATLLCALVSVIAACYLRKKTKKQKKQTRRTVDANDGMGSATYMDGMSRESNVSITANVSIIENQTYEDVGNLDDPNTMQECPPKRINHRSAIDKSVRYSAPPTQPCDENYNAVGGVESYELVVLKEDDGVVLHHNNDDATTIDIDEREGNVGVKTLDLPSDNQSGMTLECVVGGADGGYEISQPPSYKRSDYEMSNPAPSVYEVSPIPSAAASNYHPLVTKEVSAAKKKGYVEMDYPTSDVIVQGPITRHIETGNILVCNSEKHSPKSALSPGQDGVGMPTVPDANPAYFTLTPGQLPLNNTGSTSPVLITGSASPVLIPDESQTISPSENNRFPSSIRNSSGANDKPEINGSSLKIDGEFQTSLIIHPLSLSTTLGSVNQPLTANPDVMSNTGGRSPRLTNGRKDLDTGNTYQQVPLASPIADNADSSVYEKLNRGFLAKTLSH